LGKNAADPLVITLRGFIEGTTLSNLQSRMDEFKWRTNPNKVLTIAWTDMTDREWLGYRQRLDMPDFDPGWVQTYVRFALTLICPDPRARATSETDTSTSGSPPLVREINVGSAPHPVIVTIEGNNGSPLEDPVVTYRDYANADTGFSFSLTTASGGMDGDTLYRINTETHVVEISTNNGSSWSNGGGDFSGDMIQIDPQHGGTSWPLSTVDLRLTATAGSCDQFRVQYYKRWW
jgi:hypothetical protein